MHFVFVLLLCEVSTSLFITRGRREDQCVVFSIRHYRPLPLPALEMSSRYLCLVLLLALLVYMSVSVTAVTIPSASLLTRVSDVRTSRRVSSEGSIFRKRDGQSASKLNWQSVGSAIKRIPMAMKFTVIEGGKNFVTSCGSMIPVGLLLNVNMIKEPKLWMKKGVHTGLDWAAIGAYFVAGETFSAKVRNVDDRLNAYIGSGVSSAMLRIKQGPYGIAQGFVVGYAFMYVIDRMVGQTVHPAAGPTMDSFSNSVLGTKKFSSKLKPTRRNLPRRKL